MKTNQTNTTEIELKRYSDGELEEFKMIILQKLNKSKKTLKELQRQGTNENGVDDTSPTFKCQEEGNQCRTIEDLGRLIGRQEKFIRNLESALARIENKTYGACRVTGKLISKPRLKSCPHATLSMEAKEAALPLNGEKININGNGIRR